MRSNDTASLRAHIMANSAPSGECLLWLRAKSVDGYGHMKVDGKTAIVSRLAYELWRGPIPEGMEVCHNCPGGDNPACVNPDHLWLGTHTDNMRDREKKGRANHSYGDANPARLYPERLARGAEHHASRLTVADIPTIRAERQRGVTLRELSERYHVSIQTIDAAVKRRTWKYVA